MMNPTRLTTSLLLCCLFVTLHASAQTDTRSTSGSDIPRSFSQITDAFDHVRQEVMIPMRDGTKLFTIILIPKNIRGQLPLILTRTPYSAKDRTTRHSSPFLSSILPLVDMVFAESGYILVFQDVRGIHKSEGDYVLNLPLRSAVNNRIFDECSVWFDCLVWFIYIF
jgi:predicted acyl esterase